MIDEKDSNAIIVPFLSGQVCEIPYACFLNPFPSYAPHKLGLFTPEHHGYR